MSCKPTEVRVSSAEVPRQPVLRFNHRSKLTMCLCFRSLRRALPSLSASVWTSDVLLSRGVPLFSAEILHAWMEFVLVRGGRKSRREQRNHVLLYHLAQTVNHPFLKSGSLAAALSRRNEGECTRSWASAETCLKRPKGTTAARLCIRLVSASGCTNPAF